MNTTLRYWTTSLNRLVFAHKWTVRSVADLENCFATQFGIDLSGPPHLIGTADDPIVIPAMSNDEGVSVTRACVDILSLQLHRRWQLEQQSLRCEGKQYVDEMKIRLLDRNTNEMVAVHSWFFDVSEIIGK